MAEIERWSGESVYGTEVKVMIDDNEVYLQVGDDGAFISVDTARDLAQAILKAADEVGR